MTMFQVTVREIANPEFREVISTERTRREAERTQRGVLMNLNYDDFYCAIEEAEDD